MHLLVSSLNHGVALPHLVICLRKNYQISPAIQEVVEGEFAEISCASYHKPVWELNRRRISESDRIVIDHSGITILGANMEDHGTYHCYGSYRNGMYFVSVAMLDVLSELISIFHIQSKHHFNDTQVVEIANAIS